VNITVRIGLGIRVGVGREQDAESHFALLLKLRSASSHRFGR
jgi:hypothetical protein